MHAIVDCNSFYCACERVFYPAIWQKPVVVLSNNDGCIISRTDEAKALGVGMGAPLFENKALIEQNGIITFSSNYNLYGDMSRRVMESLKHVAGDDKVEVYSVDEAFINLNHIQPEHLHEVALALKNTTELWTGIKVSVGVAPTRVLAKAANHMAKKNKLATNCIMILDTPELVADALKKTKVEDVWGIGRQYAQKLQQMGLFTAWDVIQNRTLDWARTHLGGVVGVRLLKELRGEAVLDTHDELVTKKMIATTRMFGTPVTELSDIKEAVATYTSGAAEKLRRQHSAANIISVFVVQKEDATGGHFRHGRSRSAYHTLPVATAVTSDLIKVALQLAETIYSKGQRYAKAGIMLSGLVPQAAVQQNLFLKPAEPAAMVLMDAMDNINFSMRDDVIKFAASGTKRNWKMRQEYRSPRHTTRWDELREVR